MFSYTEMLSTICLLALLFAIHIPSTLSDANEDVGMKQPRTVIQGSPRFIVKLPDDNLLCFAINGFELFTFNLITSSYLVVNGFLNVTEVNNIDKSLYTNSTDSAVFLRGFSDIGMLVKAVDTRWKGGKRVFKHVVNGGKMKAALEGFGEMDMRKGSILFSVDKGHSNIESEESKYETFRVVMDKPALDLKAVSDDGHTFSVYVDDSTGLRSIGIHGLIGQFYSPKVRINLSTNEFTKASGRRIPIEEGPIWDTVNNGLYTGQKCWYPESGYSAIDGEPWEYVVEHLLATSFKRSLFRQY